MLWVIAIISFVSLISIFLASDSWLSREYRIYKLVSKYPYVAREFIKNTYATFE